MPGPGKTTDPLTEYRQFLVAAEQKSQEDFDKTILALSGGALGISFTFLKEVIGTSPIAQPSLLLASWLAWAFSTLAVLASYFLSHLALRMAIKQVDAGTIYDQVPGESFARATAVLNASGAVLFVLGVCAITLFASANLLSKGVPNGNPQAASPASQATSAKPSASAGTGQQKGP